MLSRTQKLEYKICMLVDAELCHAERRIDRDYQGVSQALLNVILDDIVDVIIEEHEKSDYVQDQLKGIVNLLCDLGEEIQDLISNTEDEDEDEEEEDEDDIIDRKEALRILRKARKHMAD